jgi:hypothetical protein
MLACSPSGVVTDFAIAMGPRNFADSSPWDSPAFVAALGVVFAAFFGIAGFVLFVRLRRDRGAGQAGGGEEQSARCSLPPVELGPPRCERRAASPARGVGDAD